MSTACGFHSWVPQKHGARQSHQCLKPSFSEHRYPHASPPVTEPAQGAPRAIRGQPSTKFVRMPNHVANPPRNEAARCVRPKPHEMSAQTEQLSHEEPQRQIRVSPCGFLGNGACPRALGPKRVRVRIREKEGFTHPWLLRVPCFWGTRVCKLHAVGTYEPAF